MGINLTLIELIPFEYPDSFSSTLKLDSDRFVKIFIELENRLLLLCLLVVLLSLLTHTGKKDK